ncbi:MAG: hypothetical protein ACTSQJ_15405 [Promethearchaeota archaeon]
MSFCGNVLELIEKKKILDELNDFVHWKEIENNFKIDVYIEKSILPELINQDLIIIDAIVEELSNGKKVGMLFIKNTNPNVYGHI